MEEKRYFLAEKDFINIYFCLTKSFKFSRYFRGKCSAFVCFQYARDNLVTLLKLKPE